MQLEVSAPHDLLSIMVTWKRTEQTTQRKLKKRKKKMTKMHIYVDCKIVSEALTARIQRRGAKQLGRERHTQLEA